MMCEVRVDQNFGAGSCQTVKFLSSENFIVLFHLMRTQLYTCSYSIVNLCAATDDLYRFSTWPFDPVSIWYRVWFIVTWNRETSFSTHRVTSRSVTLVWPPLPSNIQWSPNTAASTSTLMHHSWGMSLMVWLINIINQDFFGIEIYMYS